MSDVGLSRRERRVLRRVERRRGRRATLALRWRLRARRIPDREVVEALADAIRATIADPELWVARTEDELLDRYRAAGFDVRSLEDAGAAIPTRVADDNAVVGAKPRGLAIQLRSRYRFRGRLAAEVEQLLYEVFAPLVHNAAVYGFRVGAPDERRQALWVLAAAVSNGPDERESALADPIGQLAYGLARAKAERRMFTGLRPVVGEFNNWYGTQVAQWSYWTYRERHIREQGDLGGEDIGRLIRSDACDA